MKSITRIIEYFAERTPGSMMSRRPVLKLHLIGIGTDEMVDWHCGSGIRCLATDTNISCLRITPTDPSHESMDHSLTQFFKVFLEPQSISVIHLDGCEEQFLVENIRKDLNDSTNLRIIATPR